MTLASGRRGPLRWTPTDHPLRARPSPPDAHCQPSCHDVSSRILGSVEGDQCRGVDHRQVHDTSRTSRMAAAASSMRTPIRATPATLERDRCGILRRSERADLRQAWAIRSWLESRSHRVAAEWNSRPEVAGRGSMPRAQRVGRGVSQGNVGSNALHALEPVGSASDLTLAKGLRRGTAPRCPRGTPASPRAA